MTQPTFDYETLLVERKGDVEWLTLNRPDRLNALNRRIVEELDHYFTGLRRRLETRIVAMKANGRAFCAGLDLGMEGDGSVHGSYNLQVAIGDVMKVIASCPQPVIALLHGAVCGGGFTMALAADIRIAAPDTRMNAAFIKIGLTGCDMGSSYFLSRLVGVSVASELLLTGRFIDAERALRVNLVSEVVDRDQLEKSAQTYIDEILLTAPMGLRLTKQALRLGVDAPSLDAAMALEDRHQVMLTRTEDHQEAVSAFLEKRPPKYRDR